MEVGRRAVLALLDRDVLAPGLAGSDRVPPADARVLLTVASGQVVYRAWPAEPRGVTRRGPPRAAA